MTIVHCWNCEDNDCAGGEACGCIICDGDCYIRRHVAAPLPWGTPCPYSHRARVDPGVSR